MRPLVEREYFCRVPGADFEEPVYAATRSKARYKYYLKLDDCCPDLRLHEIKVRAGAPPPKDPEEWRALGITERQRDMVRHAGGFDGQHKESYRNDYVIGSGGDGYGDWMDLVDRGLARRRTTLHFGWDDIFWCTRELALAVRGPYEHLSRDFRE